MAKIGVMAVGLDAAAQVHPTVQLDHMDITEKPARREHHAALGGGRLGEALEVRAPWPEAGGAGDVAERKTPRAATPPIAGVCRDRPPPRDLPFLPPHPPP